MFTMSCTGERMFTKTVSGIGLSNRNWFIWYLFQSDHLMRTADGIVFVTHLNEWNAFVSVYDDVRLQRAASRLGSPKLESLSTNGIFTVLAFYAEATSAQESHKNRKVELVFQCAKWLSLYTLFSSQKQGNLHLMSLNNFLLFWKYFHVELYPHISYSLYLN